LICPRFETLDGNAVLQLDPAVPGVFNGPYPLGIDPVKYALTKIPIMNSSPFSVFGSVSLECVLLSRRCRFTALKSFISMICLFVN